MVKILYNKQARVYMASRTESKALAAIKEIQTLDTPTPGEIRYLPLDLADLPSIKKTVEEFSRQESELHGLWNNAGIALVPPAMTAQGYSIYFSVMCLGPHLLTQLLLPQLRRAAATSPKSSVRVMFNSSRLMEADGPQGGMIFSECASPTTDPRRLYASAKAGNFFLGTVLAEKVKDDAIVSLTVNPGQVYSQIYDAAPKLLLKMLSFLLYDTKLGAYPNLWAGLSEEISMEDTGRYVIPWGRWHPRMRQDIVQSTKSKAEGGTGLAEEFWDWCESETRQYR
jgi:NAD(P)-dependent dehydrogenase (short-subunit alcohol dehydrogenase family)